MAKKENKHYYSILEWIVEQNLVNEKGEAFDFKDRPFLLDILADFSPRIAVVACAQVGKSVTFILKVLFAVKYLRFNVIYCVDTETELLSKCGWKKYNEIKVGDEILTLNPKTGLSEYQRLKEVFVKKGDFTMTEMKTKQFSALVTPNHRWLVNERRSNKVNKSKFVFKETHELLTLTEKLIPKSAPFDNQNKNFFEDDYVELLAWIFSEGSYPLKNNPKVTRICITQSDKVNPLKVIRIRELLKRLGISFKEYTATNGSGCINFILKGQVPLQIRQVYPKKIPGHDFVNKLTAKQILLFLEVSVMADGWITKRGNQWRFIQKSKEFTDIFCHMCTLAGLSYSVKQAKSKHACFIVSIMHNDRIYASGISYRDIKYKGTIWCPRTENGTFFARRGGTTYWTGNTFPTDDDVKEFVSSKVNKIVQANKEEFQGMETDNIERKELNDRFIFFKGTVSKTAAISTTADLRVHDETSRSDQNAITTYGSRTKASQYKGSWQFSNPGVERDSLDLEWNISDQKEWIITCGNCNEEQMLTFPESINIEGKYYQCQVCKIKLEDDWRRQGKWVRQNTESKISGYHISHLMCCWITAEEVIEDSLGDPAYFNNFVLGKPYSPGDLSVTKQTILDLWTPRDLTTGKIFIGIDVGNIKHYVIRSEKGLLKMGRFSKWEELDDLIKFWKPTAGVIDAMPDNTAAKHYVDTYPWMQMSFFQENNNNPQTIVWWGEGDKKGIVYSHRDRILDRMLTDMIEAKFLIAVQSDKNFQDFIKHFETLRRAKVVNNKGIERYVWESTTGQDHYCFACLYAYLAMQGDGAGVFFGEDMDKPAVIDADNNYDLSKVWADNQYN